MPNYFKIGDLALLYILFRCSDISSLLGLMLLTTRAFPAHPLSLLFLIMPIVTIARSLITAIAGLRIMIESNCHGTGESQNKKKNKKTIVQLAAHRYSCACFHGNDVSETTWLRSTNREILISPRPPHLPSLSSWFRRQDKRMSLPLVLLRQLICTNQASDPLRWRTLFLQAAPPCYQTYQARIRCGSRAQWNRQMLLHTAFRMPVCPKPP